MLHKKRDRSNQSVTIILGRLQKGYYYISDSLNEVGTKIKIPITVAKDEIKNVKNENNEENSPENNLSSKFIESNPNIEMKEINKKKIKEISFPRSSSWFDIDKINEIEVNSLPEFFNNQYPSKKPEVYKNRNFIINLSEKTQINI